MTDGKNRILEVLSGFTGRDREPHGDAQIYILKAMWLMMLSEFEASVKIKVERYIDEIKTRDISNIHICLLTRNFLGDKQEELTLNKIVSFYKKNPQEISYRNFTQDRVPKYKTPAIEKLFNNLGIFFNETELISLSILDSIASTRDSIAHGDIGVQITRSELELKLQELEYILSLLTHKLKV
ncbi:HEPN domain-containing protein [Sulfurovum sp.]|uniref:HEPN domain-containing protein n=1 Tax=Sulfurovum sp. TaxID=1969726 RepID=UPI002867C7BD|nr:HEPN domain-containing protein [Sulfurovum sp.]